MENKVKELEGKVISLINTDLENKRTIARLLKELGESKEVKKTTLEEVALELNELKLKVKELESSLNKVKPEATINIQELIKGTINTSIFTLSYFIDLCFALEKGKVNKEELQAILNDYFREEILVVVEKKNRLTVERDPGKLNTDFKYTDSCILMQVINNL